MKKVILIFALMALTLIATAQTQTWYIGTPNATDITAVLTESDSTLTITGTGNMMDWDYPSSPWYTSEAIKRVVIGENITSIGDYAFFTCLNSISVTVLASVPPTIKEETFHNRVIFYIPPGSDSAYRTANLWSNKPICEIGKNILGIWEVGTPINTNITAILTSDGTLAFAGTGNTINYKNNSDSPWYEKCYTQVIIGKNITSINNINSNYCLERKEDILDFIITLADPPIQLPVNRETICYVPVGSSSAYKGTKPWSIHSRNRQPRHFGYLGSRYTNRLRYNGNLNK